MNEVVEEGELGVGRGWVGVEGGWHGWGWGLPEGGVVGRGVNAS